MPYKPPNVDDSRITIFSFSLRFFYLPAHSFDNSCAIPGHARRLVLEVGMSRWYRVRIGNETGWISRADLNVDLDEAIRRTLPVETP